MRKPSAALDRAAVDLAFEILELAEPVVSAAAMSMRGIEVDGLVRLGLLVAAGHQPFGVAQGDDADVPIALSRSDSSEGYEQFDPHGGFVASNDAMLRRFSLQVDWVLDRALSLMVRNAPRRQTEIVPGLVWEAVDVRIGRIAQRRSIWFARRLFQRDVQSQLREVVRRKPHPRERILLTSTPAEGLDGWTLEGLLVVSIQDVLRSHDDLSISPEILGARISGVPPVELERPVVLSPDGTTLRVRGYGTINFRSENQIEAIRALVIAYNKGTAIRVVEVTDVGSFRRLFGTKRWEVLSKFILSEAGQWRIVL